MRFIGCCVPAGSFPVQKAVPQGWQAQLPAQQCAHGREALPQIPKPLLSHQSIPSLLAALGPGENGLYAPP